jgi:hypothetical protein
MKKILKSIGITAILIFTFLQVGTILAQEDNTGLNPSGVKRGELTNCFDYYKFGGIGVTVGTPKDVYKPYDAVEVVGEIVNSNPYPILNTTLRARILRSHPNPVQQRALYTTVDDVTILDNITLKANEKYPIDYIYFLSGNAPSGDYKIQYYVYNQDRFNLSGLSFTEDIIANSVEFKVEGKQEHVYLDKTNITVDGKNNDSRGFITQHNKSKDIPVNLPLVNPTNTEKEIEITYKLYRWDELLKENLIDEKKQQISILPNSKKNLEYIISPKDESVYYVVIAYSSRRAKNIEC